MADRTQGYSAAWTATTEAEHEAFDFLMSLGPVFDLRFTDDSTFPVQVVEPYDVNRLPLTEVEPA